MRLRNIPGADDVIQNHPVAIKNEIEQKGKWHTVFGNENPIHIEIGMGKVSLESCQAESADKLYWNRAIFECFAEGIGKIRHRRIL